MAMNACIGIKKSLHLLKNEQCFRVANMIRLEILRSMKKISISILLYGNRMAKTPNTLHLHNIMLIRQILTQDPKY